MVRGNVMDPEKPTTPSNPQDPGRRDFIAKACTLAVGGAAVVPPILGGLAVTLDPLQRGSGGDPGFVRVTTLEALPKDGVPRKFTIFADRVDAWNRFPAAPVGAIYLRRTGDTEIAALHSSCPHAGCFVDYLANKNHFYCPCHNSAFGLDGAIETKGSPAARPLDTLQVEVRNEKEVWVKFQNFRMGTAEKIPV